MDTPVSLQCHWSPLNWCLISQVSVCLRHVLASKIKAKLQPSFCFSDDDNDIDSSFCRQTASRRGPAPSRPPALDDRCFPVSVGWSSRWSTGSLFVCESSSYICLPGTGDLALIQFEQKIRVVDSTHSSLLSPRPLSFA